MTVTVTCHGCGWTVDVDGGKYLSSVSADRSAKARAAGHASATGCDYEQIQVGL